MAKMERCRFSTKRLSFYIDRQLSDRARLIVEKHLSICKYCQNEIILLYNARLALKNFPRIRIPSTLDKKFTNRLYHDSITKIN